ncbi:MAG: Thermosome subunit [Candidatus Methanofastidiosum methylothiophilum]|uniref:Thermosome subunit n=1 Tax=Candidatus Methanofastidiosum methylothiophilum TaxID=1705564 RepID=A0A150ILM4_9EURY|nr:MAG: Thermosome subunit [Candidatus Methanofastidiosum methylthiophilus]KYC48085.1 MAG: Thermosome subunit [Candidatus Methanofastidiosum methylthiophilus]KYC50476.1 MAG: Thermosome subunit [Candidatus Methanofastidiosum methylthiophilus]
MAEIRQPMSVQPEGAQRFMGRDAQRMNILAGRIVAETVKTTLGPRGMDKMLVDSLGDVVITNDGATILSEMDIAHPAAKMIVEVAKTQDEEVGDGTTTAVVIAGELLKKAEDLLDQDVHATVVASGYKIAAEKAEEILKDIGDKISINDEEVLLEIAKTAMTGKGAEKAKDTLAPLALNAVKQVAVKENGKYSVETDDIKVEKKEGGSVEDSKLIQGLIIDKERVHDGMPKKIKDAKIALLDCALEVKETETDAEIRITSPDQLQAFLDQEEAMLKKMVDQIKASGATVVFCQKGIDDLAQHYLAKSGIYAARRVKKSDMKKLAKATGARVVNKVADLEAKDLGHAGSVEEKKIGGDEMTFVEGCKDPKSVSLLLRGGTEHFLEEVERALEDAIGVISTAIEDGTICAGGGAAEMELSKRLNEYAEKISGREQLAVKAFAQAMEIIPRTLAENAGMDPIDTIVALKASHETKDHKRFGIDIFDGKVKDMMKAGVVEPLRIKEQAVKSASESAIMILRIDDVIAASGIGKKKGMGGGDDDMDMGGSGGMPGGMPGMM